MNYWMGVVLMVGAVCFAGLYYAYEQSLFERYYI